MLQRAFDAWKQVHNLDNRRPQLPVVCAYSNLDVTGEKVQHNLHKKATMLLQEIHEVEDSDEWRESGDIQGLLLLTSLVADAVPVLGLQYPDWETMYLSWVNAYIQSASIDLLYHIELEVADVVF